MTERVAEAFKAAAVERIKGAQISATPTPPTSIYLVEFTSPLAIDASQPMLTFYNRFVDGMASYAVGAFLKVNSNCRIFFIQNASSDFIMDSLHMDSLKELLSPIKSSTLPPTSQFPYLDSTSHQWRRI